MACTFLLQGSPRPTLGQDSPVTPDSLATPEPIAPAEVQVIVTSAPTGRPIILNGDQLETRTPATLELSPGQYSLVIAAEGHESLSYDLFVRRGQNLEVNFLLLKTRPKPPTPQELRGTTFPGKLGDFKRGIPGTLEKDAAVMAIRSANNDCLECHPSIPNLFAEGLHQTISCTECHGPYSDHVKDGNVIAEMPVVRGGAVQILCMSCHDSNGRTKSKEPVKTVAFPEHLNEKMVDANNTCEQCHHVHAPMKWVDEAREIVGIPERMETVPLLNENIAEDAKEQMNSLTETFFVFPLAVGIIGKTAFGNDPVFPSNELFLSGVVLVAGTYFLGDVLHSRKLENIKGINAERAAANLQAKEYNQRMDKKMTEYYRALRIWEDQSAGRGMVIVKEL